MLHGIVSGCQLPSNDHLQQFFKSEWERERERAHADVCAISDNLQSTVYDVWH